MYLAAGCPGCPCSAPATLAAALPGMGGQAARQSCGHLRGWGSRLGRGSSCLNRPPDGPAAALRPPASGCRCVSSGFGPTPREAAVLLLPHDCFQSNAGWWFSVKPQRRLLASELGRRTAFTSSLCRRHAPWGAVFSTPTKLCSRDICLVPEHSITPKRALCPLASLPQPSGASLSRTASWRERFTCGQFSRLKRTTEQFLAHS